MANFVEFKQGEAIRSINLDNVDLISLFLCDVGKSDISIAFNSDGVPLNIDFETKEEAQALYDLLRGTNTIPTELAKDVVDRLNIMQKHFKDFSVQLSALEYKYKKLYENMKKEPEDTVAPPNNIANYY